MVIVLLLMLLSSNVKPSFVGKLVFRGKLSMVIEKDSSSRRGDVARHFHHVFLNQKYARCYEIHIQYGQVRHAMKGTCRHMQASLHLICQKAFDETFGIKLEI